MSTADPTQEPATNTKAVMPLMDHLKELRNRLIVIAIALVIGTVASLLFAKQAVVILIKPMGDNLPQALKPTETLSNYMKVALVCGVTLAMPIIVYQIGRFIMPGLNRKEKRYLWLLVPGATLCFVTGVAFAYYVLLPMAIPFLQGFLSDVVKPQWTIGDYLSFVANLIFWIGVSFELPLFVYFLSKTGIITYKTLWRNFKYAVVLIAVLAAVITPTPDPFNMGLVMVPLIVLYLLGVLLARIA